MTITVEAVCENGVLKPAGALPLQEHQKVVITVKPAAGRDARRWVNRLDRQPGRCRFCCHESGT
jgi:predicted DNA-binding antitoxin AbrB/MazE fold protein